VIFPGFTWTDRLIHIDEDGTVVEDRALPSFGFLASLPDGRYLAIEQDETPGYVLRVYDRRGESTLLYDESTLMRDANWPPLRTDVSGFYPYIEAPEFRAIVDDAGNAYVGFVLETNGSTTETYLVAFAPSGQKLWGLNLSTVRDFVCQPVSVLSGHRLVVRCPGRYVQRLLILGE
jgi:hypothetical protein